MYICIHSLTYCRNGMYISRHIMINMYEHFICTLQIPQIRERLIPLNGLTIHSYTYLPYWVIVYGIRFLFWKGCSQNRTLFVVITSPYFLVLFQIDWWLKKSLIFSFRKKTTPTHRQNQRCLIPTSTDSIVNVSVYPEFAVHQTHERIYGAVSRVL